MPYFIVTAFGEDRPGIVAKVTEILYENQLNIEDSSMTRLNNEFTIMLIVKGEKDLKEIKDAFSDLGRQENLYFVVKELPRETVSKKTVYYPQTVNIVLYGADKLGIVYNVSKLLSNLNINISDLRTEKTDHLYIMFIEAQIPAEISLERLEQEIEKLRKSLNVDITIHPVEEAEL